MEFVDAAYCINLDARTDRWFEVTQRFAALGVEKQVKRVSAVVAEDPRKGCRQSHLRIVEQAQAENYRNILIFEDDVLFLDEHEPDYAEIITFLEHNREWDLFYLGGSPMYPAMNRSGSIFRSRFYHTHAYIINERAYSRIHGCGLPIDVWYSLHLRSYGIYPLYAVQGSSVSDIQNRELTHLKESMLNRYDKLVRPNVAVRWWNYFYLHYLYNYLHR